MPLEATYFATAIQIRTQNVCIIENIRVARWESEATGRRLAGRGGGEGSEEKGMGMRRRKATTILLPSLHIPSRSLSSCVNPLKMHLKSMRKIHNITTI